MEGAYGVLSKAYVDRAPIRTKIVVRTLVTPGTACARGMRMSSSSLKLSTLLEIGILSTRLHGLSAASPWYIYAVRRAACIYASNFMQDVSKCR